MRFSRLDWAQWMAEKGINVFICSPGSKKPLQGKSWHLYQSNDPDTIEEWFEEVSDCNYGLHLGDHYVVIDLDRKPGINGVREFEEICAEHGVTDFTLQFNTLMVKTPGGGYHIYFKTQYPCANKNMFPQGIDVRGVKGYVVGPGSEDSRGEWAVVDTEAPIMDLPDWLDEYVVPPGYKDPNRDVPLCEMDQQENIEHAKEWLKTRAPAIAGQNGDDWTYETIQYLRDFGVSESEVLNVISEWNQQCEPPWVPQELEVKITNAWNHGQNRPGCKSPTYQMQRVLQGHNKNLWAERLTPQQIAEMFKPSSKLDLNVTQDDEIPHVTEDNGDNSFENETTKNFTFKNLTDFVEGEAVRQYIIYEWLLSDRITHMVAKRGTGKSTIALDMAMHIAYDLDWCGIPTQKGWKVVYICGEDDTGMRLNVRAWLQDQSIYDTEPVDNRIRFADEIIKLNDLSRLKMRIAELKEWAGDDPVFIVLDTWQRATSGWGKNDAEAMEEAIERAEGIAKQLNGAMLSLVHPPKDGRMTVKGAGEQEDTSVGIFHVKKQDDGIRMEIERIKGPGFGKYLQFKFERPELPGKDAFDKPLTGQIIKKIGGSEDKTTIETKDRLDRNLKAWGDVIWNLKEFLHNDNEYKDLDEKNYVISTLSELLAQIVKDAQAGKEDAIQFKKRHLNALLPYLSEDIKSCTFNGLKIALEKLWKVKKPPTVKTDEYQMEYVFKNPKTQRDRYFKFEKL